MACLVASQAGVVAFDQLRDFRAFTVTHALVLIAFVLLTAFILIVGVRLRNSPRQRSFERALGVGGLIVWLVANAYGFLPHVFLWDWSLPIQVCDLAALIGPIVVLQESPARWPRAALYFFGIGLCTQAFFTPTLNEGPVDPKFWCFWAGHFVILSYALYDLVVRRWRPAWHDWRIAVALSLAYLLAILVIDIAFGWNYGFVGNRMAEGTMMEVLGPWPGRVFIILALVLVMFTAMLLPWLVLRRRTSRGYDGAQ